MEQARRPAVAGRFYPGDPGTLAATVDRLLDEAAAPEASPPESGAPEAGPPAAAYVVPHAGYAYSGPTAARVYARLRPHAARIRRVVLVGPSHFVRLHGCAVSPSATWETPLGGFPVAAPGEPVAGLTRDDAPHAREHALEVQLPFLQRALGRPVPIVPIAVGEAAPDAVAGCLAATAAEPGTLVLCSTDLSHYLDRAAATERDARTAAAVEALAPERIGVRDACGAFALRGLLAWARAAGLRPELVDLATSADTAGDPHRVVGYAGFAFHPPEPRLAETGWPKPGYRS